MAIGTVFGTIVLLSPDRFSQVGFKTETADCPGNNQPFKFRRKPLLYAQEKRPFSGEGDFVSLCGFSLGRIAEMRKDVKRQPDVFAFPRGRYGRPCRRNA